MTRQMDTPAYAVYGAHADDVAGLRYILDTAAQGVSLESFLLGLDDRALGLVAAACERVAAGVSAVRMHHRFRELWAAAGRVEPLDPAEGAAGDSGEGGGLDGDVLAGMLDTPATDTHTCPEDAPPPDAGPVWR